MSLRPALLLPWLLLAAAACSKLKPNAAADPDRFFENAKAGKAAPVREGLAADPKLAQAKDPDGQWTALHLAGSNEVAQALLEAGADLEARAAGGMTPLHAAIHADRKEVAQFLIGRKASLAARMQKPPYTPLQLAAVEGRDEVAALLMELSSPQELAEPVEGETLLHIASRMGQETMAELLLLNNVDPNLRNRAGQTPIFLSSSARVAGLLLDRKADLAIRSADGGTVLSTLIRGKAEGTACLILQSPHPLDAEHVGGALLAAAQSQSVELLKFFLPRHPEFHYRRAALLRSAQLPNAAVVALLAGDGVAQSQDARGTTPLHVASNADVTKTLLNFGLFADARDDRGQTPLFLAAAEGRLDVARTLLTAGADPGAVANDGSTALHMACARDDAELANALMAKGAEANTRDKLGVTPLHYAANANNLALADVLLHKGADPLAPIKKKAVFAPARTGELPNPFGGQDMSGRTPMDVAASVEMRRLLEKYRPGS